MRMLTIACFLALAGCSAGGWGYWPKVEGDMGARYQTDVRDCQTETQPLDAGHVLFGGGLLGAAALADDSKSPEGKSAINDCMTKRGYRVIGSN